jgi:S-adenosylmethionine:diacylglycerol 3-amino-3-carboxypropyl transferase
LETAWQAGRLGWSKGSQRLLFGRMYEDVEIEREAFCGKGRVFCIASAGDTALRLAEEHEVTACDINPVQLAYAERRANGGHEETGEAERGMNLARALMPLAGWRRGILREFLELSDVHQQMEFWRKHLDNWRFRAGFDALMSRPMLRTTYARQFLSFLPKKFGAALRKRLERGFAQHANRTNPHAWALLLGEECHETPSSAEKRNVRFVLGDAAAWLESRPEKYFDAFTLSNILDGAEPEYRLRLIQAVRRTARDGAVVVLRSFGEPGPRLDSNRAACDQSMLWGIVDVRPVEGFETA